MTMTYLNNQYSCTCPSGYILYGVSGIGPLECVLSSSINEFITVESRAISVNYPQLGTSVVSLTMKHYFATAAANCKYSTGPEGSRYCQILANLCVLHNYDTTNPTCSSFNSIVNLRLTNSNHDIMNWVTGMPWLYYTADYTGSSVCKQEVFTNPVNVKNSHLKYVIASYSMNGTFVSYQNLETFFSYCKQEAPNTSKGGGESSSTKWQIFGYTEKKEIKCKLRDIMQQEGATVTVSTISSNSQDSTLKESIDVEDLQANQRFYELFIYDPESGKYSPVPVRVLDAFDMKAYASPLCDSSDRLVRRFFLHDFVSGQSNLGVDPAVVRYASFIRLETLRVFDDQKSIYPPVLTISYTETRPDSWPLVTEQLKVGSNQMYSRTFTDSSTTIVFESAYTMDMTYFWKVCTGFFIAQFVLTGLAFMLRYYNWNMRNSRVTTSAQLTTSLGGFNIQNIIELTLVALNTYVLLFFPFILMICWYFFVFFKLQTVPSILLPFQINISDSDSDYYAFFVIIHLMAFFQLTYVLVILVYRQGNNETFLIDWEVGKEKNEEETEENSSSKHDVSAWRTLFIANKYLDLQVKRRSSLAFTLFWTAFFLIGLDLEYNSISHPDLNDIEASSRYNAILRFANTSFFVLILTFGQYIWKWLIYERYFSEPPEQKFIDFCTIANISLLILNENYHGFYLHCQTPNQYSESTMLELVKNLAEEESGLVTVRALSGAPDDIQSFEVFLSGEWRGEFDKIKAKMIKNLSINDMIKERRSFRRSKRNKGKKNAGEIESVWSMMSRHTNRLNKKQFSSFKLGFSIVPGTLDETIEGWKEMTKFLNRFLSNTYSKIGLRHSIKVPTYFDKMTRNAPDLSLQDQPSIFYTDKFFNFVEVMFLGNETNLVILNILTIGLFDLWFNNTFVSLFLTYLIDLGLSKLRYAIAKASISRSNIIDTRFII